ncbi:hypothetical protein L596_000684 [Steinernema carpocapsae]|uniref:Protein argonaute N-terminal domain-containing protein n=1 Tax=Steinernema carpocapsae TaxID=34508 RepID=A0A4U8UIU6_STECR|nr:hypothetical protein L596_000684 [Steinernema carpocapsae]
MAASSSRRPQSLAESRDASDSAIVPLAVRPAFGTAGKRIPVTANCCKINIDRNAWGQHVYRYYVEMYINGTRYMKPAILRRIFWDVVDNNRSLFPAFGIVFNDKDQLWSKRKFNQFEFEAQFGSNNDHTIKLKLVDMFDFQISPTSDQIQAEFLNSLLTQTDRCKLFPNSVNFFVQRDRLFFIPTEGSRPGADDLGRGLQMWYALHSLVSVGEKKPLSTTTAPALSS